MPHPMKEEVTAPCRPLGAGRKARVVLVLALIAGLPLVSTAQLPLPTRYYNALGELQMVVTNNDPYPPYHQAGFHGISELYHQNLARNVFVPFYCGLNFEHIFSGDVSSYTFTKYDPRKSAIRIDPIEKGAVLTMRQARSWPLKTVNSYHLVGPRTIEFEVHATPLADVWRKHGYIGLFFSSYIHGPEVKAIHFIGRSRLVPGDSTPRWITYSSPQHGYKACHRPAFGDWEPAFDAGFPIGLISNLSDYEYLYPFFYGRTHGLVLIYMFEPGPDLQIRFSQSPTGGGPGSPAWDFAVFKRNYVIGQEFSFKMRLVVGRYTSEEDVIRAYERWSGIYVPRV